MVSEQRTSSTIKYRKHLFSETDAISQIAHEANLMGRKGFALVELSKSSDTYFIEFILTFEKSNDTSDLHPAVRVITEDLVMEEDIEEALDDAFTRDDDPEPEA